MTHEEAKELVISISNKYQFGDDTPIDKTGMTEDQIKFWESLENTNT